MAAFGRKPLFTGSVSNGSTTYVGLTIHSGVIGAQLAWKDATSSGTVTVELTNYGPDDAPVDAAGDAWEWKGSGVTIAGPAASAAGSVLIHFENVRSLRARLKFVAAAASVIEVLEGVDVA